MPWFQEYPQKRAIDKTTGKDCRYNEGILISELKRQKRYGKRLLAVSY
jgi:hypothetical protein